MIRKLTVRLFYFRLSSNLSCTCFPFHVSMFSHYLLSLFSLLARPSALDPFIVRNTTLDYLRATLGYSYRCRNEETLNVAQNFSINTFQVQVQPFGVTGNQFGAGSTYN